MEQLLQFQMMRTEDQQAADELARLDTSLGLATAHSRDRINQFKVVVDSSKGVAALHHRPVDR